MIEHYSHKIQNAIQKELFKANKSIKIAVAWFTNDLLFQPLLLKLAAGVTVEIILNKDEINCSDENEIDFDEFVNAGGILRWNDTKQLLHDKFCIIDDQIVIYGSYNWTNKAEYNEESIAIAKEDSSTTSFYLDKFTGLSKKYDKVEKHKTLEDKPKENGEELTPEDMLINNSFARGYFPDEYQNPYNNKYCNYKDLSDHTYGLHFFDEIGIYDEYIIAHDDNGYSFLDTNTFVPLRNDGRFNYLGGFCNLGIIEKQNNSRKIWVEIKERHDAKGKWGLYDILRVKFCIPPLFDSYRRLDSSGKYEVCRGDKKWFVNINKMHLYDEMKSDNLDF